MCNLPLLDRVCLESYNDPEAVYQTLKRRGMDLVTVTDHDSIDAVEHLRRYPDFFLSEEITCRTPSGTEIHVGAYGIEDRHHVELQRRRNDVPALAAYLREQKIFFTINHVFSSLTGRRAAADFELFAEEFPGVETRNGQIPETNNRSAECLAHDWRKTGIAGSDAHTLHSLALTYTEVPGASGIREYLRGLRHGRTRIHGRSGDYMTLTRAILEIGCNLVRDYTWSVALAPLLLLVPIVTLGNYVNELRFDYSWSRRLLSRGHRLRIPSANPLLEVADVGE
jgi:predicted metal-dependent phosphoesterase TrpH